MLWIRDEWVGGDLGMYYYGYWIFWSRVRNLHFSIASRISVGYFLVRYIDLDRSNHDSNIFLNPALILGSRS